MSISDYARVRKQGWRILKYATDISADGNLAAAFYLCVWALGTDCTNQYEIAQKAAEIAQAAKNYSWIEELLGKIVDRSDIPGRFVADLAKMVAQEKDTAGQNIEGEIAIIKRSCLDAQNVRFIRAFADPEFSLVRSYEVTPIEPAQNILPASEFRPAEHHPIQNVAEFLSSKARARAPLDLYVVDGGSYFYNGSEFLILDRNENVLSVSSHSEYAMSEYRKFAKDDSALTHCEQIFIAQDMSPAQNYCHWVVDWFPRIVIYDQLAEQEVSIPVWGPRSGFEAEYLKRITRCRLLDCRGKRIVKAERIAILSASRDFLHPAYLAHPSYIDLLQKTLLPTGQETSARPNKIYVSRAKASRRRLLGEERLGEILAGAGFKIVYPEDLTVAEQIATFANAQVIAGTHGAGLSNIVFAQNCHALIEIFPPEFGTAAFQILADGMNIKYYYYYANMQAAAQRIDGITQRKDFTVPVEELAQSIIAIGREHGNSI